MRAKPASEYSDDERRELLARQKASGMSIREFAATLGLSGATISHWRWRLSRKAASSTAHKDEPTFVQLAVDRPEPPSQRRCATTHFELQLASGLIVRVPMVFDKDALAQLLSVLGTLPC